MIQFHLDENIHPAVADGLRVRQIDVTTAADAGLLGATDDQHLAFAFSQQRVLVTHDDDLLVLHSGGVPHSGVVYCHQDSRTIGEVIHGLVLIHQCLTEEEMHGAVQFL